MDQITAATLRGLYGAVLTGLLTLLTSYQTTDSWTESGVAAGVAALGYLIVRGGIEGIVDGRRNAVGAVTPADVGAFDQPIRRPEIR